MRAPKPTPEEAKSLIALSRDKDFNTYIARWKADLGDELVQNNDPEQICRLQGSIRFLDSLLASIKDAATPPKTTSNKSAFGNNR